MACTHEYKSGKELLDIAINGLPDANFTEEQRLAFDYAAIYVKYGIYPKTYMALARADGQQRIWSSTDGITIVTRNGQIIRADGLPFVSSGVRFEGEDPFELGLLSVKPEQVYFSKRDFASVGLFGSQAQSSFSFGEVSEQSIAGKQRKLQQVTERLYVPDLDFSVVNHYWVEQNNNKQLVWRSEQQLGPDQPLIRLEGLMPYYEDI
ncbi:YjbF family lipoprotein [Agarivorans gilvus]|uniref:YjbF family lipoprotein n=1 Tax=Agarivorans gilvus TaxID=680279 RepID=A0ABQ1HYJ6_9ALTE|nr:YjbF family lipoprotein [Agarivorans gilvus]GGA99005.1 hypothetical protein GCM10007414_10050 [Agarivorans gilvus]